MKIVRVIYTTKQEYAATNQANIRSVVNELEKINHPGIKYSTYLLPDGKTFMHFDQFENEDAHGFLMSLASFQKFAAELEASELETEPKLELLLLVASTEKFWD
jgi:quinol monooxygenase YgiN